MEKCADDLEQRRHQRPKAAGGREYLVFDCNG
jgi:hypothetical protein